MAQVTATATRTVSAPAERVLRALADYRETRPTLLTEHFSEYEVRAGGVGAGTTVHWKLAATSKRVRDCVVEVSQPADNQLVERDSNSSMVTTWSVRSDGERAAAVTVRTTWNGASGIGGFFERVFAPLGLRRIYQGMLSKLEDALAA